MNFKTNEELREIWESENFEDCHGLFYLAFDEHSIYFDVNKIAEKLQRPENIDELLKQFLYHAKDYICNREKYIPTIDTNKSHKYAFQMELSGEYSDDPYDQYLLVYQKKNFEEFVSSYEDYKQKLLKKEEEDKKKMEKKREKNYELYLKLKEEFEHENG